MADARWSAHEPAPVRDISCKNPPFRQRPCNGRRRGAASAVTWSFPLFLWCEQALPHAPVTQRSEIFVHLCWLPLVIVRSAFDADIFLVRRCQRGTYRRIM